MDASILRRYGLEPDPVIEAYKKDVDRTPEMTDYRGERARGT